MARHLPRKKQQQLTRKQKQMFTIKHIESYVLDGKSLSHESIRSAQSVWTDSQGSVLYSQDASGSAVDAGFHTGTIYVMNENGKTIAKYFLG